LCGANKLLEAPNPPIILLETDDETLDRMGSSRYDILSFLKCKGFLFWEINSGILQITDGMTCHDIFCTARGIYGDRFRALVNINQ